MSDDVNLYWYFDRLILVIVNQVILYEMHKTRVEVGGGGGGGVRLYDYKSNIMTVFMWSVFRNRPVIGSTSKSFE